MAVIAGRQGICICQAPGGEEATHRGLLATRRELFPGKGTGCLQHAEARLPSAVEGGVEEALVEQRADAVERFPRVGGADGGRCFDGESGSENPQPPEEDALPLAESVVTPGDGITERALPGWRVAGTAAEERKPGRALPVDASQDGGGREVTDPRGGELDGERESIEARAQRRDRRRIALVEHE